MKKITITFRPANVSVEIPVGKTVLEAANAAGITLDAPCGGRGRCGKCLVRLRQGISPPTAEEKIRLNAQHLKTGHRLACLTRPQKDTAVELLNTLEQAPMLSAGRTLNFKLRTDYPDNTLGLALDIGTTTIAAALYDLCRGVKISTDAVLNAQLSYGADLMSRLNYCLTDKRGANELHRTLISSIKGLVENLCRSSRVKPAKIKHCRVVGNTAMLHFFLGQDPRSLATYPFTPAYHGWRDMAPRPLGLSTTCAVRVLPYLNGFVGADCLGVILATGLDTVKRPHLAIDIGTNSEIVLAAAGRLLVASSAAGPALEGGGTSCGMRAATGAIDSLEFKRRLSFHVIGNGTAKGLCGSGLLDLLAVLRRSGTVQEDGLLVKEGKLSSRVSGKLGRCRLRLSPAGDKEIYFTQQDIRQLQLAKGAIAASAAIFLEELALTPHKLEKLFLAGAFGNYIDINNALEIGLLPAVHSEKIIGTGNAALDGAAISLLATGVEKRIDAIVKQAEHIELNLSPKFQDLFAEAMALRPLQ